MARVRLRAVKRVGQSGSQLWVVLFERVAGVVDDQVVQSREEKVGLGKTESAFRSVDEDVAEAFVHSSIGDRESEGSRPCTPSDEERAVRLVFEKAFRFRPRAIRKEPILAVRMHGEGQRLGLWSGLLRGRLPVDRAVARGVKGPVLNAHHRWSVADGRHTTATTTTAGGWWCLGRCRIDGSRSGSGGSRRWWQAALVNARMTGSVG